MSDSQITSYAEANLETLKDLLTDDNVNEVVINPNNSMFVEMSGAHHMEPIEHQTLSQEAIQRLGSNLAGETGNKLGQSNPIVSGRVTIFGHDMRVQVVVPPAVENGVSVSIRKFLQFNLPVGKIEFVAGKQVNVDQERLEEQKRLLKLAEGGDLAALLKEAIDKRLNILISGGTSSGKTTIARSLLSLTDMAERIVTIEDAIELNPENPNNVALVAERRGDSNRTPAKLLESSLRMRPDRLILGEIRGPEALNFLEAINTGHPGSISTIHADSPALALERMALMVMQSGVQLSRSDVIAYATSTIDMIVQVGRREGRRGVLEISMPSIEVEKYGMLAGKM